MDNDLQRAAAANADAVVRRFFDADGRLTGLPAKQSRQLAVYNLIAQRFVPGVRYTEPEVNRELMAVFGDYVTLRRGLIDFGLMDRADGFYWRSGGTVPVGTPATDVVMQSRASVSRGTPSVSARGAARREAILTAAAQLFAERGYAAVGMDDIGAAAGVTGPAIYRHFGAKASVLTAVFDRVIDAVTSDPVMAGTASIGSASIGNASITSASITSASITSESASSGASGTVPISGAAGRQVDPAALLRHLVHTYAAAVSGRRGLMAVFIREVHHLPAEDRDQLVERQRALVGRWRTLLGMAHPDWDGERVRTAVHAAFGMLNAVGTFESPLDDEELAAQLAGLAEAAFRIETSTSS